jgi:esterase/lipase
MYLWLFLLVAGGLLVWVGGDLLYFLWMRRSYARWEGQVERDAEGVRAGCREFTIGQGETALLLIHGFGDSPAVFRNLAPALANQGFTCRAMRLPGFAMPITAYRQTRAAQWRQAVQEELANLRRRHARVGVVAHSLGAAIAVDALVDQPEAAAAAVLLAPLLGVCNRRSPLLSTRTWFYLLDHSLWFTDRIGPVFAPDLHDPEGLALLNTDRFVPRTLYREMFTLMARNCRQAHSFGIPLLMVLSRNDLIVDNPAAERFFQECAAAPKQLKYQEEAGHVLPLDGGWKELVEDIIKFLAELPGQDARPMAWRPVQLGR